jgi:hypothetical protein
MNTVEIPLKIQGIAQIRAELKALKSELANATDPQEMARLAAEAGKLSDQLKDANEKAAVFATGSKYQQSSNAFRSMKDDLMELDFEGAQEKAKIFSSTLASINPKELGKGFGQLMGTMKTLGGAFMRLGMQIMVNPIFLIVAAVAAIIAIIVILMKKFGVLEKTLEATMKPLNLLISGLEALTDWLGLTTAALDRNAAQAKKNNETVAESSKERAELVSESYEHEIAMAKLAGKDTTKMELEKSKMLSREANKRKEAAKAELEALAYDRSKDGMKRKKELQDQINAENKILRQGANERKIIEATDAKEAEDKAKEAAAKAKEAAEKAKAKREKDAQDRLKAGRELRDFELSQIEDAGKREEAITREKYARLLNDLKKDESKNAAEKIAFQKMYETQLQNELDKQGEAQKQKLLDNEKKANDAILQIKIALMPEGEAKELAIQNDKYNKLREAAIADVTLTEEKRKEILALYDQQRAMEDQKKEEDRAKKQAELQISMADQETRELEALRVKYEQERLLAEGNAALLLELQNKYLEDQEKIQQASDARQIEEAKKKRDALIQTGSDIFNGLSNLGGMLIKDQKKLEKFNKASALVQIGIDTAKAISSLVAASQSNPFNSVTAGGAGIAQFAIGIIQIATNIAKAKQILTSGGTPSAGGGGGASGGGGGGSASTAQVVPQAAQLFGQGNTSGTMSAGGTSTEQSGITVTAVVSETSMTSTQNKINRINKNAEL